jgi:hypothetical protein
LRASTAAPPGRPPDKGEAQRDRHHRTGLRRRRGMTGPPPTAPHRYVHGGPRERTRCSHLHTTARGAPGAVLPVPRGTVGRPRDIDRHPKVDLQPGVRGSRLSSPTRVTTPTRAPASPTAGSSLGAQRRVGRLADALTADMYGQPPITGMSGAGAAVGRARSTASRTDRTSTTAGAVM